MGYKVFLRIVVPYEGFKDYQEDSCRIVSRKLHKSDEGVMNQVFMETVEVYMQQIVASVYV